ncbi:hypothetical protein C8J56DRAFT_927381 [Mycena floridula]|nr:hypothetical protein C8J56DRAFT_927381 [Mycena floridula]
MADLIGGAGFSCLNGLAQVMYQGSDKLALFSDIDIDQGIWNINLVGKKSLRLWRGCWSDKDVVAMVGSKASEEMVASFANKLAASITQGDLSIQNWNEVADDARTDLKLILGPGAKKPLHVPMVELSAGEAAQYASELLFEIALMARKRGCQLEPSLVPVVPIVAESQTSNRKKRRSSVERDPPPSSSKHPPRQKESRAESSSAKPDALSPKAKPVRALKGASLANPNKKARHYVPIEFGSDDE